VGTRYGLDSMRKRCLLLRMGHQVSVPLFSRPFPISVSTKLTFLGYSEDTRHRKEQPVFERGSNLRLFYSSRCRPCTQCLCGHCHLGAHHYKIKIIYRNKIISSTSFQLVIKLNSTARFPVIFRNRDNRLSSPTH